MENKSPKTRQQDARKQLCPHFHAHQKIRFDISYAFVLNCFRYFFSQPGHSSVSNILTQRNICQMSQIISPSLNGLHLLKRFCLVFLCSTQTTLFNENCVHFCLNSTKGDVDLEERDGFLGFSIPSMNPLDHICSLSKGEMLLRYC